MPPCPYCAMPGALIHVHGHGQCPHCGVNVEPCCGGGECHLSPQRENDDALAGRVDANNTRDTPC